MVMDMYHKFYHTLPTFGKILINTSIVLITCGNLCRLLNININNNKMSNIDNLSVSDEEKILIFNGINNKD